jgi:hypothetical protein
LIVARGLGTAKALLATAGLGRWVVAIAVRGGRLGRRTPRRTREYEAYLRAIAEGRAYLPEGQADAPAALRTQYARRADAPTAPASPDDAVTLELAADWFAAYRAARLAYAQALLARWREEDDVLVVLLLAV